MVTIYNTTLSATSQRHFSDSLGGVVTIIYLMIVQYHIMKDEFVTAMIDKIAVSRK